MIEQPLNIPNPARTPRFNLQLLLVVMCLLGTTLAVWSYRRTNTQCRKIDAAELARISDQISSMYHVTHGNKLELTTEPLLPSQCLEKVTAKCNSWPSPKTLVYSPELHSLFTSAIPTDSHVPSLSAPSKPVDMAPLADGAAPVAGAGDAKVTIVEFSDYQCPYCKVLQKILEQEILPKNQGKIRILYRYFPLSIHQQAQDEAEMAACVEKVAPSSYPAASDALFAEQGSQTKSFALDALGKLNFPEATKAQILACTAHHETKQKVDSDVSLGEKYNVRATPTLFVNGTLFLGIRDAKEMQDVIDTAYNSH